MTNVFIIYMVSIIDLAISHGSLMRWVLLYPCGSKIDTQGGSVTGLRPSFWPRVCDSKLGALNYASGLTHQAASCS